MKTRRRNSGSARPTNFSCQRAICPPFNISFESTSPLSIPGEKQHVFGQITFRLWQGRPHHLALSKERGEDVRLCSASLNLSRKLSLVAFPETITSCGGVDRQVRKWDLLLEVQYAGGVNLTPCTTFCW